ncbi:hypothetical protein JKF63_03406 [Porcisia hertigi]|uniref:Uncharacterized protein n=1 Tax=Porcisia hertigi TaxID=2761500 RepID=A0A836L799_9TRYP|nr:hypothetical protein JKF63_03406 [Porcisia hertigi]
MTGGMKTPRQAVSPPVTRLVDVDEAVRILHQACQSRARADTLAPLVESAHHLASHCTPALLSSVLEACDATAVVEAAPKKLVMLNAAWKLLLTIVTHEGVQPDFYRAAVAHMVDQLRWGVLSHDWSDKKRIRLATFFASHVVSTVRAHPQFLVPHSPASAAVIDQLVQVYFAVCVTVATSMRDTEAVSLLYDNIVVRLHTIFDCLGNAVAVTAATTSVYSGDLGAEAACRTEEEDKGGAASSPPRDGGTLGPSAALPPQLRYEGPSSVVEKILTQCVSTVTAREVEEAAVGGVAVRMAAATAAFSLYLHVVRGVLGAGVRSSDRTAADSTRQDDYSSTRNTEGSWAEVPQVSNSPRVVPLEMQELVMESMMWWTHRLPDEEQLHASETRVSLLRLEVLTWAAALPPNVFCHTGTPDASAGVSPLSLRALWTDTLATAWLQWLCRMCDAPHHKEDAKLAGSTEALRAGEPCQAYAMAPESDLGASGRRKGEAAPPVLVAASSRFASVLLLSVAGTLHSSSVALMVLEAWAQLFRRAEAVVADPISAIPPSGGFSTTNNAVAMAGALLRVLADLRCGAVALVEGLLRLKRFPYPDDRSGASSEQPANLGCTGGVTTIPLQWICSAVALLAYGEAVLGVHSLRIEAGAQAECTGQAEGAVASRVIGHLIAVMRAYLTPDFCGTKSSAMERISEASAVADATTQLHALLVSVKQQGSIFGTKGTSASAQIAQRTRTALCLVGVPRAWCALVAAMSQLRSPDSVDAEEAEAAERWTMELKAVLLSLGPLLASLTHTLESLDCEQGLQEASERAEKPCSLPYARVARWVAARLLDGVAVVPLTDSSEDAVLVACVRRWTDLAFEGATCAPGEGSAAVRTDDPVSLADATAALLHVVEECTTLPLEKFCLSEHATRSLMELLQGNDASVFGEFGDASGDGDVNGRCPPYLELWCREAAQWCEMEKWLLTRPCAMGESERAKELSSAPALADELRASLPSSHEELARGLLYCEAVLRHLHDRDFVLLEDEERQYKRHRNEKGVDTQVTVNAVLQSVGRIQELSRSFLLRAGGASGTDTPGGTAAMGETPIQPPPPAAPLEVVVPPASEGDFGNGAPVVALTGTRPVGGGRVRSDAEVISVD